MNWWQTLTITAVPALLTLILTQRFERRRREDDRRDRRDERQAEERTRMRARREGLEDAFRDRRVEAHAEFLRVAHDVEHHLGILVAHLEKNPQAEVMLDLDLMGRYSQAYAIVQIVSGDPSKGAAESVDAEVDGMSKAMRSGNFDSGSAAAILRGSLTRLREDIRTYALWARRDGIDPREEWADQAEKTSSADES